ncbi:MAG: glycosyltransferase family 39 protein, partial [Candidatus Aminicenantes bacterium]|nr:glycosyltransferase family 39 protein [Candidatus Aminicenantes bacterium]
MKTLFRGKNLYKTLLLVFLIIITALRIFYSQSIELFFDEAYYWDWARHLDLGYLDQPPLVAYLIAASTKIFGNTEMAIRLPAVIFSAATTIVIFFFAKRMFKSEKYALISAFLLNLILLFNVDSILMLPDTLLIFFWVLTLYLFYLAIKINPRYWYLAGLSLGLALLSKCIGVLLIPVIGLTLLFMQKNRRWLCRKELYISLFI